MTTLSLPSKKWLRRYTFREWLEAAGIDPDSEQAETIRKAVNERSTLGESFSNMYRANMREMLRRHALKCRAIQDLNLHRVFVTARF